MVEREEHPDKQRGPAEGSLGLEVPNSNFPTGAPGKIDSGE